MSNIEIAHKIVRELDRSIRHLAASDRLGGELPSGSPQAIGNGANRDRIVVDRSSDQQGTHAFQERDAAA